MSSKSTKSKNIDNKEACVHLETMNKVSHSLQPLCYCSARDLVLGKSALVCSVCSQFKKSDNEIGEMYIAVDLESDLVWDDEDFYEVIKDEDSEEEEEDEDDDMPKKRRTRKKKVVEEEEEEEEEEDEEEKKKKAAEEEKISEELFGRKEKEVEEVEIEDDEAEIHEVYDRKERKLAKAKEKGIDIEDDDALELIDDLDDEEEVVSQAAAVRPGAKSIEIETTKDGKQRCPFCKKEFASVARHITRCKYAGPGDVEAVKKAVKKLKK